MSESSEEQVIKTNCRGCHGGCGVLVHVKNGRITKIGAMVGQRVQ